MSKFKFKSPIIRNFVENLKVQNCTYHAPSACYLDTTFCLFVCLFVCLSVRCVQNKYKGKGFVAQKHDCVLRSVIDVTTKRLQNFIKKQQLELAAHVHITYNEETHRLARTNPCSEEWQKLSDRSPGLLAIPCTVEILQTPIRHDVCVFVSSDKVPVVCATIAFSQHRAIAPPSFQHTQTHTHTHTHTPRFIISTSIRTQGSTQRCIISFVAIFVAGN